jgi:hypothetical protein
MSYVHALTKYHTGYHYIDGSTNFTIPDVDAAGIREIRSVGGGVSGPSGVGLSDTPNECSGK